MSDYLAFLFWPLMVCLALSGLFAYFGLHIIQRGVIFVDLALAQIAALGITIATLFGFDERGVTAYLLGLGMALLGALLFTVTRKVESRVPQEAIIGLAYAFSAALVVMLVSHSPEGAEHIRHLLVGNLLSASATDALKIAAIFAVLGGLHWVFRERFIAQSFGIGEGGRIWDFFFYVSFAVAVTASVQLAGVLLIFIFLVGPAVFAALTVDSIRSRLSLGWSIGILGSLAGMSMAVWLDTPIGATIVSVFGLIVAGGLVFSHKSEAEAKSN